jgi:hypothetical protein
MWNRQTRRLVVVSIWLIMAGATTPLALAAPEVFSGDGSASTSTFRMDGPWSLTWQSSSEFPRLVHMEIHLYDAARGRQVGVVAQQTGVAGRGERLIREAGEYRLSVIARNVGWRIRVEEAEAPIVDLLAKNPNLSVVRLVAPNTGLARELINRIASWQAEDDQTLLLRTSDGRRFSASFSGNTRCPGLVTTASVYFVTADLNGDIFNAILLEDGTRCYLGGVIGLD